ncbi:MAG: 2Fe-2S iron-sulfur cluster binding domain-containing protein [Clostridia bacterium]|nr:2Fe-2S iron-sulfur cluster binding domain-containing protein [Clostridia bacterium]
MIRIEINGTPYETAAGESIKGVLTEAGFKFPCGGVGRCGKCRIVCKDLTPTDLDRRFLTERQIADGVRLACDKVATGPISLSCEISHDEKKEDVVLHECSVAATICDEDVTVSIVSDHLVETVKKKNPLNVYPTMKALAEAYQKDGGTLTKSLRAVIGKESVELFEKYGGAKAQVTALAAKDIYLKILAGLPLSATWEDVVSATENDPCGLPTESIYLLPALNEVIGGEVIAECVKLKEKSLLVDCEKTATFYLIGEKDDLAAAIWDCSYDEIGKRCVRAAAKYLSHEEKFSAVYLYGKYASEAEDALEDDFACIRKEKSPESVVDALLSFRTRAKLNKEKNRTTYIRLYDREVFQRFLTEEE